MPRRAYQAEFRRKVVEEHVKGRRRVSGICHEYGISAMTFRCWKDQYQAGEAESLVAPDRLAQQLRQAQRRIDEELQLKGV